MNRFRVKCIKVDNDFVLTIRANTEEIAIQEAYTKYKVDHAEIHNETFEGTYQRKACGYHHTYRRSSLGRAGQVIFS